MLTLKVCQLSHLGLPPTHLPPHTSLSEIKRLVTQTKKVKAQALGLDGCYWLPPHPLSLSLSHSLCFSSSLFVFVAVSHNVRVKWHGAASAPIEGVLLCGSRVYLTWGRLHLFPLVLRSSVSDIYRLLSCVCLYLCVTQWPKLGQQLRHLNSHCSQPLGFCNICPIHPDAADLSDTNVYFPLEHYDVR